MIIKPEQASPHTAHLFTEAGNMVPVFVKAFTAKETAEIATAYAECAGKYINAVSVDMEREASDEMDKWQDRFIEWGWMK